MFKYLAALATVVILGTTAVASAAPTAQNFNNIQPFITDTYYNGSATNRWLSFFTKNSTTTLATITNLYLSGLSAARIPYTSTAGLVLSSVNLAFNDTANRLTVPNASTTAISSNTFCINNASPDCINAWTTGGASAFSFLNTWNALNAATSSNVWVQGVFNASSSAHFSGDVTVGQGSGAGYLTVDYASTTALSASNLTSGNCLQAATGGFVTDTGLPCGSGGGGYPFTPGTVGSTQVSATSTAINDTAGYFDNSWRISSSTVVCAYHCQYSDIQTALDAGYSDIFLKSETYTLSAPLQIKRNSISIQGNGRLSKINFDTASVPVAFGSSSYAAQRSFVTIKNVLFNQTGTVGTGTCMDITNFPYPRVNNVHCAGTNLGLIATSTGSFYGEIANTIMSVSGVGSIAYQYSNIANDNVLINTRAITSTDSIGYDFTGVHAIKCIMCNTETNALIGMRIGAGSGDLDLNVYLEGNQVNMDIAAGAETINVTGFIADADDPVNGNIVDHGALGLKVDARVNYDAKNYLLGNEFTIGTTTGSDLLTIEGDQNTFFVTSTSSTANITVGAPTFASPKGASTLFLGSGLFGNEDTSAYGADESSGNIRFNGSGIAWGDFGYYPNSGSVANSYGNFRLSVSGGSIDTTPDAKLGVGSFFANGRIGFSTTSPWGKFTINLDNKSVPQGNNAFLIASSTQTSTTTLFSVSNVGDLSFAGRLISALTTSGNFNVASTSNVYFHWVKPIMYKDPAGDRVSTSYEWECQAFELPVQKEVVGVDYPIGLSLIGTSTAAAIFTPTIEDIFTGSTLDVFGTATVNATSSTARDMFIPLATTTIAAGQHFACLQWSSNGASYMNAANNAAGSVAIIPNGADLMGKYSTTSFGTFYSNAPALTSRSANAQPSIMIKFVERK